MNLDVELIRKSFAVAKPLANEVSEKFYEILFNDYPQAKPLFQRADMQKQKKALMVSLVYIVDHIEDSVSLEKYLKSMGGRHLTYGTEEEHYNWVGESLIKTFKYFFAENWTEDLDKAWKMAYGIISDTMREGAHESEKLETTEDLSHYTKKLAVKVFEKSLNDNIEQEFYKIAKVKARDLMEKAINEVAEEVLKESFKKAS